MARLPRPGGDNGTWGDVLNDYLSQSHKGDGTLKDNTVTPNVLAPNSVTNTAIASNAVNAASIADGAITETLLDDSVQDKLNQAAPTWTSLSGKPAVVAAGDDQAAARTAIGVTALTVDGSPVASYNLDSTPLTASDVGAYSVAETDDVVADAIAGVSTNATLTGPKADVIKDVNGNNSLQIYATPNAVNYLRLDNSAAGNGPSLVASGTDTHQSINLTPKGTGGVTLWAGSNGTGTYSVSSSATNVDMNLVTKGAGVVKANNIDVVTISGAQALTNKTLTNAKINSIMDVNGNSALSIGATTNPVNYVQVVNAATGGSVGLWAVGSDTNIGFDITPKGNGKVQQWLGSGQAVGQYGVAGTATNIDVNLSSKGTGTVKANSVEVATISGAQTLTNKTLTGARISGGSGTATISAGTGTPDGVVTATVGSLYMRTDGGANSTLYVKESGAGNTGWIAK